LLPVFGLAEYNITKQQGIRHPHILNKVVEHFNIDQFGTNFPKEVFDPSEVTAVSCWRLPDYGQSQNVLEISQRIASACIRCFSLYLLQEGFEESLKRRRIESSAAAPSSANVSTTGSQTTQQASDNMVGTGAPTAAHGAAAALAAAMAAINSVMAANAAVTTKPFREDSGPAAGGSREGAEWGRLQGSPSGVNHFARCYFSFDAFHGAD
jgi:hypothetical protein